MNPVKALENDLASAKLAANLALHSLIRQCERELRNLNLYDDSRMLIATFDIKLRHEEMESKAEALELAFQALQEAVRDAA